MARGRPIIGVDLIERLDGPRAMRRHVRIVLATIAGGLTITQACAALGVGRSRFHALRWRVLAGALDALRPRPRGRPRRVVAESSEVRQLRARIQELEVALRTTALRSEIALTMPHLLDRAARKKKRRRSTPIVVGSSRPCPPERSRLMGDARSNVAPGRRSWRVATGRGTSMSRRRPSPRRSGCRRGRYADGTPRREARRRWIGAVGPRDPWARWRTT